MTGGSMRAGACCGAVVALLLVAAAPAGAKDGGSDDGRREARVSGRCSAGATAQLRLRSRDGSIRLEFELRRKRSGSELWRVTVVQERRVRWRGNLRTRSGSLRVRRSLRDLSGPDRITVRASGPRGLTCEAAATLRA